MLEIKKNILLAPFTTFRIGGPAKFFVEISSEEELLEALNFAKANNLEFFILGGGSNLLVSDKGYDGIVIQCKLTTHNLRPTTNTIEAGAGMPLALLVNLAAQNSLAGMEWTAGIPGTIGGAVRGNAGAFGSCIKDAIQSVKVFDTRNSQLTNYNKEDCKFGYRYSIFKENPNLIILVATLRLKLGDKEEIQNKIKEIIEKRSLKQPKENSGGSFFTNPVVIDEKLREEFEHDCGIICKDDKLPAGWLIDQAGLRGKKIGGAMVSEKHANFIVNTGQATAEDVIMLASIIKQQVRDKFRIELVEEVQYLGF